MKVKKENNTTNFKVNFSSSRSNFSPSLKSASRNFAPNIDTNRGEDIYDEVVIYDGGDVDGYGYEEEEES